MVEERHTSENASFTGYCVEFWHGDILLAVAATASPAAEALRAALRPSFKTCEKRSCCSMSPCRISNALQ